MKILVTGGCGFIGTNLVELLSLQGHEITVYDKLTYAAGGTNHICTLPGVKIIEGDICNFVQVKALFRSYYPGAVINMAAESHVTRSEFNPELFFNTNYQGAVNIMFEAVDAGVPRIIHFSTDEVYGSRPTGYFTEEDELRADADNNYAQSKVLADKWAMERKMLGVPIIVVRPANNFGPWQNPEKALGRWITSLLLDRPIEVWSPGNQVRDWLYVGECAKAIAFLLEYGELGEAYNISAMNYPEITNLEMAQLLCSVAGRNFMTYVNVIENPRHGHDERYAIDHSKLRELGFAPETELDRQIYDTYTWYCKNRDWWMARKAEAEALYTK